MVLSAVVLFLRLEASGISLFKRKTQEGREREGERRRECRGKKKGKKKRERERKRGRRKERKRGRERMSDLQPLTYCCNALYSRV